MASHKTKSKKLVSFSINKKILESFNNKTKSLSINKSLLIENFMKEWIK